MPAMHLMSVDLPAPLSPTSAITSPTRTSKSTSVSACTDPKVFDRPRISRSGVSVTGGLRPMVEAPGGASTIEMGLLAVLLVLPRAHVAALQELVLEETRVVGLRDRDHGDHERRLLLRAVRPCGVRLGLLPVEEGDSRGRGRVRLVGHVLVDGVRLPSRDDVLDTLNRRVLPTERDRLGALRPPRLHDRGRCGVVCRRDT